jgi:hypothetical protein
MFLNSAASQIENATIIVNGCQNQPVQKADVGQIISGVGLAIPVPGVNVAVSFIGKIISGIFQHHAQALARDFNFGCSAVPAVNQAFEVLIQGVQNGTMNPLDAANALPQIYSEFMAAGGASGSLSGPGGIPGGGTAINDSPYCNSNCEISIIVLGMVFYWQAQFLAQVQPAAVASLATSVGASSGSATLATLGGTSSGSATLSLGGNTSLVLIVLAILAAFLL